VDHLSDVFTILLHTHTHQHTHTLTHTHTHSTQWSCITDLLCVNRHNSATVCVRAHEHNYICMYVKAYSSSAARKAVSVFVCVWGRVCVCWWVLCCVCVLANRQRSGGKGVL